MTKFYFTLFLSFFFAGAYAQNCPTLRGAMINACGTNEGPNEFISFKTGTNALNVNNLVFSYASSANPPFSASATMYINGSVASTYVAKPSTITLSGCGIITVVSAGQTIPANSNVVLIYSTTSLTTFDLSNQCLGGSVYVLFVNPTTITGATGFVATGNFANTSTRYLNISSTAAPCSSANNGVSYSNGWASNIDGNAASWDASGTVSYVNGGCSSIPLAAPLPITYSSFAARYDNKKVTISWATSLEVNNHYFAVEYSNNGNDFEDIAKIDAARSSFGEKKYSFVHENPKIGVNYYRLRQVDTNGQSSLSNVEAVRYEVQKTNFWLHPTASNHSINIESDKIFDENTNIEVLNLVGQTVLQSVIDNSSTSHTLDISSLAEGQYFLRINGTQQGVQRFVKM